MVQEQPDQLVGQQPEHHGKAEHRQRTKSDPDPPSQARIEQLPGTVVLADAHRDRIRQPGRHHERHRDDLQGDLMRAQLRAAHGAHAQRGERKQPDFYRVGAADRQAQSP
ncbi:hypothetical protein D3C78_1556550 [compost metagenome]